MRSGESRESGCNRNLRKMSLMRERFKSSTPPRCYQNLITILHNSDILQPAEIAAIAGVSERLMMANSWWRVLVIPNVGNKIRPVNPSPVKPSVVHISVSTDAKD